MDAGPGFPDTEVMDGNGDRETSGKGRTLRSGHSAPVSAPSLIEITLTDALGRTDRIEADTLEDAIYGARTIFDESCSAYPYQGWREKLTLAFWVAGQPVRVLRGVRP